MKEFGKLNVAVDVNSLEKAQAIAEQLPFKDRRITAKLGLETLTMFLVSMLAPWSDEKAIENLIAVRRIMDMLHGQIGIDLKMADIPNTLTGAAS